MSNPGKKSNKATPVNKGKANPVPSPAGTKSVLDQTAEQLTTNTKAVLDQTAEQLKVNTKAVLDQTAEQIEKEE